MPTGPGPRRPRDRAGAGPRRGRAALDVVVPDQGSYRADLRAFLMSSFVLGRQFQVPGILRALMARAQIDEEFGQRFRASFLQRRRDALEVIVDRAQDRGDLPRALSRDGKTPVA